MSPCLLGGQWFGSAAMTTATLLFGCAALAVLFFFFRSERRRAHAALAHAATLEAEANPEAAFFYYAVAASAGAPRHTCETGIRRLWATHGPFTFGDAIEDEADMPCGYKSCGQGYRELMLEDVLRIVGTPSQGEVTSEPRHGSPEGGPPSEGMHQTER